MGLIRQPKGTPSGGEFAKNEHSDAPGDLSMSYAETMNEITSVRGLREQRELDASAYESARNDGRDAGFIAAGFYNRALDIPLTSDRWEEIEESLRSAFHHVSNERNTWQPVHPELRGLQQQEARTTFLRSKLMHGRSRSVIAGLDQALAIPRELRLDDKDSIRTLSPDDRTIADARMLLAARQTSHAVPGLGWAVKTLAGKPGKPLMWMLGKINGRNRIITELQRTVAQDGPNADRARRMLRLLELSNRSSSDLADEIAEKRAGRVGEGDLRDYLSRRSHMELVGFRFEMGDG